MFAAEGAERAEMAEGAERVEMEESSISGTWLGVNSWTRRANLSRAFITDTTAAVKRYVLGLAVPYQRRD
jgi:hypothetical protein